MVRTDTVCLAIAVDDPLPGKSSRTGVNLTEIIVHYLPLVESAESVHEPISIVVITDSAPGGCGCRHQFMHTYRSILEMKLITMNLLGALSRRLGASILQT